MGFFNWKLAISSCIVFSACLSPARAQTVLGASAPDTVKTAPFLGQEFHCHTGYPLAECQKDILRLKTVLAPYPIGALGHWTWVLVRSVDWQPISLTLGLNPDSPAFTALEPRETFLEEGLFAHNAERSAELMTEWNRSMPELLNFAVSHELGHALCFEPNEATVNRFAEKLRHGLTPPCRATTKNKKAKPGSTQTAPGALRAP